MNKRNESSHRPLRGVYPGRRRDPFSLVPVDGHDVVRIPIRVLMPADSPRLGGEDADHVRVLAESEAALPPILVHRETMRVIDGMHRLRAALSKDQETIEVRFFEGNGDEAFLAAVEANTAHGLPLTLAEREAAAARILASHPIRSDSSIAAITGISAKTVGAIRRRSLPNGGLEVTARIGRDGRVRPLNSAEGRRIAGDVISARPNASLREIAKCAGISHATARDVRERMLRGDDPVPPRLRMGHGEQGPAERPDPPRHASRPEQREVGFGRTPVRDPVSLLQHLSRDPSLRYSEAGRELLRWLHSRAAVTNGWEGLPDAVPPHCTYIVAELARGCAQEWSMLAAELEQQLRSTA